MKTTKFLESIAKELLAPVPLDQIKPEHVKDCRIFALATFIVGVELLFGFHLISTLPFQGFWLIFWVLECLIFLAATIVSYIRAWRCEAGEISIEWQEWDGNLVTPPELPIWARPKGYDRSFEFQIVKRGTKPRPHTPRHILISFCDICKTWRPPRCHHCRTCNKCVAHFDHHCWFTSNCVGWNNFRYFMMFCYFMYISCVEYTIFAVYISGFHCLLYVPYILFDGVMSILQVSSFSQVSHLLEDRTCANVNFAFIPMGVAFYLMYILTRTNKLLRQNRVTKQTSNTHLRFPRKRSYLLEYWDSMPFYAQWCPFQPPTEEEHPDDENSEWCSSPNFSAMPSENENLLTVDMP